MSSTRASTSSRLSVHRSPVQLTSLLVGIAFLVVGVLGFVPGITTDYGQLSWAGPDSHAHLLGVFQVSVLHNVLHLLFGVAGVVLSRWPGAAKAYLLLGGVAYLGLWVYGLVVAQDVQANFVPLNAADDWLHLGLGAGMLLLGLLMPRRTSTGTAQTYAGPTAGGDVQ
ncbi:DUF4383 domain-containing protein [Paenibacillus sp. TRM 82003]|uniref:DUF4383 domain-containing protein n=1 Tax=Kineococcus sp. TRM81007 TaxID=2925831 RepID=UPI001F5AA557|nr:DUF4383 domain-containing protein [Kineococcus sp. TRM81007]MCI2237149.1 DUF4383 domain-containing protein [Kineococcus sp. TRM81007]MCI3925270.1 DUF4383 domain-containing protein [Paenibacillus sp. TRM 82003]